MQRLKNAWWRLKIWKQLQTSSLRELRKRATIRPIFWTLPLFLAGLVMYALALWGAPRMLAVDDLAAATPEARLVAAHNARLLTVSIAGALVVGAGLLYTARNYRLAHRGQVTDRFAKALERLGSSELYIRIGGIRALDHVMRDSADHYLDCVEVLSSFIRERAPRANNRDDSSPTIYPRPILPAEPFADVQAAFTALAHRPTKREVERHLLDFRNLHLRSLNLRDAQLDDADFSGSDLQDSNLSGATARFAVFDATNLREASFYSARMEGARFANSRLSGANMSGIQLANAHLVEANLEGANLYRANLFSANLRRADLRAAKLREVNFSYAGLRSADLRRADLTDAQLTSADLSNSTLHFSSLAGANIHDANLTGARMQNALLSYAEEEAENGPETIDPGN
ncbi:pentapeptide repeat-containing protein [Micromonospora sp. 067-2]|uniref:pentapeptide repeat-containing protein n=1 Tax=Micromonospora sp. 067-2 TaxID=2789270 RepID=UPI00397C3EC6